MNIQTVESFAASTAGCGDRRLAVCQLTWLITQTSDFRKLTSQQALR